MERDKVVEYISSLSESELGQLINEAVQSRRVEKYFDDEDFEVEDVFVLASCTFGKYKGKVDVKANIEVYAPPASGDLSRVSGPISEQGSCPKCKTHLISSLKLVTCPICKTEVELT